MLYLNQWPVTKMPVTIDWKRDDVTYKCHPRKCANFTRNYPINRLMKIQ